MEMNISNLTRQSHSRSQTGMFGFYLMAAFTSIIISFGIVANALTIRVIWKTRSLHTTTNYLLANLALSDFLALISGIPNGLVVTLQARHPNGIVGKYLCIFITAGNPVGTTTMASILTLCFLAVERYHAIVKPMAQGRRLTQETIKYGFAFIWIVPVIITSPMYIHTTLNPKTQFCDSDWGKNNEIVYILIMEFLLFIIPFVVIVTCYAAIIKELYFSNKVEPSPTAQGEDARSRRKLVKVLLAVTSLFLVLFGTFSCMFPLYKVKLVSALQYNTAVQCLYLQSCFNPIIYIFQSTNYREALLAMVKCSRRSVARRPMSTHIVELETTNNKNQ